MPRPLQSSQPRFAPGCRWSARGEEPAILFPEGMIRVKGTGHEILKLCDGQRSVREIVEKLSELYHVSDPAKIAEEVSGFLEALQRKRIVDYE